jgi:CRP/FNR family cyclic AMP-dependent transcriptional regulator
MALPQSARPPFDKQAVLSAHPLFKNLDPSIILRLASYAVTQRVKAGTTLFCKGDAGSGLYAICSGRVKITVPSEQGKDAVLNSIGSGEIFGEIALLDGGPRTADAVAVENCEFMVIERRDFVELMRDNPDIALRIIEVLCARLRRTSEQVEDVVFLGMPARLAKTLIRLFDISSAAGGQAIVRTTQREISQIIGTSRESTNKQLREWQQRKWLKLERGTITILAPEALKRVIFDDRNN